MAHGGNNMGRLEGASTRPEYYTGANLQPDGLRNEPFASHAAGFYAALGAIAPALLSNPAQVNQQVNIPILSGGGWVTTGKQYAFIYGAPGGGGSAAFLENQGASGIVQFAGRNYTSTGGSMLIIGASGALIFDTSLVQPTNVLRTWTPTSALPFSWSVYTEPPPAAGAPNAPPAIPNSTVGTVVTTAIAIEQLKLTQDDTEHVVYATTISTAMQQRALLQVSGGAVTLSVGSSKATALSAYIVGGGAPPVSAYEVSEASGTYTFDISLPAASLRGAAAPATLIIFSESLGIDKFSSINNGATPDTFQTSAVKGITGKVVLGGVDITSGGWTAQAGLVGEAFPAVWTGTGAGRVPWTPATGPSPPPMTWLRTTFAPPPLSLLTGLNVSASLQLDATGLSRGHFYINDWEISRQWGGRTCGSSQCQRYYHIPPDVLVEGVANNLTIFDAEGAPNVTAVRLVLSHVAPPLPCTPPRTGDNVSTSACRAPGADRGQEIQFLPATQGSLTGAIEVVNSGGLCWAVGGTNPTTGTPTVTLAACAGGVSSQQWTLSAAPGSGVKGQIASADQSAGGGCIDIPNQEDTGAALDLWACNGGDNQMFSVGRDWRVLSALSGRCVGVCEGQ